jgi:hypothetical protein
MKHIIRITTTNQIHIELILMSKSNINELSLSLPSDYNGLPKLIMSSANNVKLIPCLRFFFMLHDINHLSNNGSGHINHIKNKALVSLFSKGVRELC